MSRLSAPAVAGLAWVHQVTELGQDLPSRTHSTTFASLIRRGLIDASGAGYRLTEAGRQALHDSRNLRWL
jgi:Mn-dependent DtxR family transcriptional regulator